MKNIKVFCPGSVANISCGFDILGLCLDNIGDEIIVTEKKEPGIELELTGNYKTPNDINKNAASVSAIALLNSYKPLNYGFKISIEKKIKPGSGIGSSAASSAGSVYAINELLNRPFSKKQ